MPTIKGTDGDTTGALITLATTSTQLTALVQGATHTTPGALASADWDKLQALTQTFLNNLGTVPAAGTQGWIGTDEIDFLSTSNDNLLKAPDGSSATFASHRFIVVGVRVVVTQINGTITTGPTWNLGNNVAKNNVLTSAISTTAANLNAINTSGTPGFASSIAPTGAVGAVLTDTGTAFKLDITAAAVANTATVCKGRIYMAGFWIPL